MQCGEKMSVEDVQAVFAEVEGGGEGRLDYAEFCDMFEATTSKCVTALHQRTTWVMSEMDVGSSNKRRERQREEMEDVISLSSPNLMEKSSNAGALTPQHGKLKVAPSSASLMKDIPGKEENIKSLPVVTHIDQSASYEVLQEEQYQLHNTSSNNGGHSYRVLNCDDKYPSAMSQCTQPSSGLPAIERRLLPPLMAPWLPRGVDEGCSHGCADEKGEEVGGVGGGYMETGVGGTFSVGAGSVDGSLSSDVVVSSSEGEGASEGRDDGDGDKGKMTAKAPLPTPISVTTPPPKKPKDIEVQ